MPRKRIAREGPIGDLLRQIEVLLDRKKCTPPGPMFDAAVDAIREFQDSYESRAISSAKIDAGTPLVDLFDTRIVNALEKQLGIIFLGQLETAGIADLQSVTNFGSTYGLEVAAVLRRHFPNVGQLAWYWMDDDEIRLQFSPYSQKESDLKSARKKAGKNRQPAESAA